MPFERIQVSRPEPPELSEPGVQLLKRLGVQSIETTLCVHRSLHETGLAQDAQMLRYGRLRHLELPLDFSHRLF